MLMLDSRAVRKIDKASRHVVRRKKKRKLNGKRKRKNHATEEKTQRAKQFDLPIITRSVIAHRSRECFHVHTTSWYVPANLENQPRSFCRAKPERSLALKRGDVEKRTDRRNDDAAARISYSFYRSAYNAPTSTNLRAKLRTAVQKYEDC